MDFFIRNFRKKKMIKLNEIDYRKLIERILLIIIFLTVGLWSLTIKNNDSSVINTIKIIIAIGYMLLLTIPLGLGIATILFKISLPIYQRYFENGKFFNIKKETIN